MEEHDSAELLKEPARPARLEYFKYFAIRDTCQRRWMPRVCPVAFDLALRLGYPIHNPLRISEVRWEGSELAISTGDAYLLGPLRGGSAFRMIALAYF